MIFHTGTQGRQNLIHHGTAEQSRHIARGVHTIPERSQCTVGIRILLGTVLDIEVGHELILQTKVPLIQFEVCAYDRSHTPTFLVNIQTQVHQRLVGQGSQGWIGSCSSLYHRVLQQGWFGSSRYITIIATHEIVHAGTCIERQPFGHPVSHTCLESIDILTPLHRGVQVVEIGCRLGASGLHHRLHRGVGSNLGHYTRVEHRQTRAI